MKKTIVTLLVGISMAALLAGGCANKELVKKDSPVAPVVSAEKSEQEKLAEKAKLAEQDKLAEKAKLAEQDKLAEKEKLTEQERAADQARLDAIAKNRFETVYFDYDKADLSQEARGIIAKNAETILKSFATAKVQIEGHCDERGSAEYNLALGENRAKSVQKYLTTLGVKAENLSIISYGKEKPAATGSGEDSWAKNRRAEFMLTR